MGARFVLHAGVFALLALLLSFSAAAQECNCSSCEECRSMMDNDSCRTIILSNNITDHAGTCIDDPDGFDNKTFDCRGNVIDGDDTILSYGITLNTEHGNTITNCTIQDFHVGLYLYYSPYTSIRNTFINSSFGNGFYIRYSNNTLISDSLSSMNNGIGLYVLSSNNNSVIESEFSNNTEYGVHIRNSDMNNLSGNTIFNNTNHGLYVWDSRNNSITGNTILNNSVSGIRFTASSGNNSVMGNTVCHNANYDIYNDPLDNFGSGNYCNATGGASDWNDTGVSSGCTHYCGYSETSYLTFPLSYGWNLISLPVNITMQAPPGPM